MQKAKETASNIAASAKAGMDKTKATMQEKVEKMSAHDPIEKEMATEKKQEKINQAEWNKQETRQHNAAGMGGGTGTFTHSTTGATGQPMGGHQMSALPGHGPGQPMGGHQMSALPGHGTGQPMGHVTEGVVGSHPIGTNTGTGRTTGHNTHVGGGDPKTGYGTGGALL